MNAGKTWRIVSVMLLTAAVSSSSATTQHQHADEPAIAKSEQTTSPHSACLLDFDRTENTATVSIPGLLSHSLTLDISRIKPTRWGDVITAKSASRLERLYVAVFDGAVAGIVVTREGAFSIRGANLDALTAYTTTDEPLLDCGTHENTHEVLRGEHRRDVLMREAERTTYECGDDGSTVDVLFAYTSIAVVNAGGTLPIEAEIAAGIAIANDAFDTSGIPLELNIAGYMEVTHPENVTSDVLLAQLEDDADGIIDEIHTVRDALSADLVSLVFGTSSLGKSKARIARAFSVIKLERLTDSQVVAHELGHNFGCYHSRDGAEPDTTRYVQYSHGYNFTGPNGGWHTIMSATGIATSSDSYSDPGVLFDSVAAGTPPHSTNACYNALVIDRMRHYIANFRFSGYGDCNGNSIDDRTEIASNPSLDSDNDGVLDDCQGQSYVNAASTTDGTGTSWSDASLTPQHLLYYSSFPCTRSREIWIAAGEYDPAPLDIVYDTELPTGTRVYGGFDGSETYLHERDIENNISILTGDVLGDDLPDFVNRSDNERIATTIEGGAPGNLMVNGIWFTHSSSNSSALIVDEPTILTNCTFIENSKNLSAAAGGGAIQVSGTTLNLTNCRFERNRALRGGGAICTVSSADVYATNCSFYGNTVSIEYGGAIYSPTGSGVFANCVFVGNESADSLGGAACVRGGTLTLLSSSFDQNMQSETGGSVYVQSGTATLRNCVLWSDTHAPLSGTIDAEYCDIYGGWTGTGNINIDPDFVNRGDPGTDSVWGTSDDNYGDLNVFAYSPLIDAGNNAALPLDIWDLDADLNITEVLPLDLLRNARQHDDSFVTDSGAGTAPLVDIGAFERPRSSCLGDWNEDGSKDTQDITDFNNDWNADDEATDINEDGVINTQDYTLFLNWWNQNCPP